MESGKASSTNSHHLKYFSEKKATERGIQFILRGNEYTVLGSRI